MAAGTPFALVDVFTDQPLEGNPLALVPDADPLPEGLLPRIAREFHQAETTFLLRPDLGAELLGPAAGAEARTEPARGGQPPPGTEGVVAGPEHHSESTAGNSARPPGCPSRRSSPPAPRI
ncbi:PhzF family phenazine biosynthesis protein [Streptomyces nigrescens]